MDYYAERLLHQSINDPRVNAMDRDEVREYIEHEAEKLCLPPDNIADYAMKAWNSLKTDDFKTMTHHNHHTGPPKDISTSPPF